MTFTSIIINTKQYCIQNQDTIRYLYYIIGKY